MRLKRIGDKFYIKTWKYDEVEYPKRITPVDVTEKYSWMQEISINDLYRR